MSPLAGLEIVRCEHLAGSKLAVRLGTGPVYVSPAMWSLMKGATSEELAKLMASLRVLTLPAPSAMFRHVPMTVYPQEKPK